MIIGNLSLQLDPSLSVKLTELGDLLELKLILSTSNQSVEVGDIKVEIVKSIGYGSQIINYSHGNTTARAKNHINNNTVKWLELKVLHKGQENLIGRLINEYKFQIYRYANDIKFTFGQNDDLENLQINRNFYNIKDDFKNKIMNSLFLTQGNYNLNFFVNYKEFRELFPSNEYKSIHKQSSFSLGNYEREFEITLDNFLGQMMSNILFSPSTPFVLSEPTHKLSVI